MVLALKNDKESPRNSVVDLLESTIGSVPGNHLTVKIYCTLKPLFIEQFLEKET